MLGSSKAERKVSAALRAKKSLEDAWGRIDYALDVVKPAVLEVRQLEETNDLELTEADLISLLTTGELPIEAVGTGEGNSEA